MKKITKLLSAALLVAALAPVNTYAAWGTYRIMLDPGHGGSDPGASGPKAPHEAELALRCCKAMDSWLTTNGNPHKLTRTSNTTVSLSARRSASISYDPYVFCSVHLNAFNTTASGTETWYYWSAGNSSKLATKVQAALISKMNRVNRGVKQNGWTVITGSSSIPAILTEGLFVDNQTEWNLICNESNQGFKNWVNGHLLGFYNYLTGQGYSISPSPNSSPYGGGGSGSDPEPTPTSPGTITVAAGMHFTGYVGEEPELELSIKGANMKTAMTVKANYASRFPINGTTNGSVTVPAAGGTVKVKFADPYKNNVAGTYGTGGTAVIGGTSMNIAFKITISGTGNDGKTVTKDVALTAELKTKPLAPTEKWNLSEQTSKQTSKGYDASNIRNFVYHQGKLYCVYNHKDILVINAQTGAKLGFLKRGDVVKGGTLQLCDVKVLDGKIFACNIATAANGEDLRIYKWDDDNATPSLFLSTTDFQGAKRLGDCMELTGTLASDAWFAFGGVSSTGQTLIVEYNLKATKWTAKNTPVYIDANKTNLSTQATVRAYPKGTGWWVDGKDSYPTWAVFNSTAAGAVRATYVDTGESWGSSHHEFNYGGQKYSANLVFNGKEYLPGTETMDNDKNYKGARMRIIADLSGDFTRMNQVGDYPAAGLGSVSRNTNATGDIMINTDGQTYFEGWVLSTTHGMAYYAHGTVPTQSPAKLDLQEPEDDTPAGPSLSASPTTLNLTAVAGETAQGTVTVTGANLTGDVSVALSGDLAFSASPAQLASSGKVTITYAPTAAGNHTATLTLSTPGANSVTVNIKGTATAKVVFNDEITADKITEGWVYSTNTQVGPWVNCTATEDYTTSIAVKNGKLYALHNKPYGTPKIDIVNAYTGAKEGSVNMDGMVSSGAVCALGSIFFIGDKLYGVSCAEAAHALNIYRWDNVSSAPTKVVSDATHGGVVTGRRASYANGHIWVMSQGASKALYYTVNGNTVAATPVVVTLKKADGTAFQSESNTDGRGSASVVEHGDGTIWVISKSAVPTHFKMDGTFIEAMNAAAVGGNTMGSDMAIMPFGKKTYVAATTYADKLTNGQLVIADASAGLAAADSHIAKVPANGLGATTNDQNLTTVKHDYRNDGQTLDLWVAVPKQGVAHYTVDGRQAQGCLNLEGDSEDTPVQYFNLQGVEVPANQVTPGVYLRRQGSTTTKVVVK